MLSLSSLEFWKWEVILLRNARFWGKLTGRIDRVPFKLEIRKNLFSKTCKPLVFLPQRPIKAEIYFNYKGLKRYWDSRKRHWYWFNIIEPKIGFLDINSDWMEVQAWGTNWPIPASYGISHFLCSHHPSVLCILKDIQFWRSWFWRKVIDLKC